MGLYPTSEHAYQAAKIEERAGRHSFTLDGSLGQSGPMVAKMKGKHVHMRPSWDSEKKNFMAMIVSSKFARDPKIARDLVDTKDATIVEGHTGDTYWGGKRNHLGNILMNVRVECRASLIKQPPVSVVEKPDEVQPHREKNKGNHCVVTVKCNDDEAVFWPECTVQFKEIIDRWCCDHCVDPVQHRFTMLEPMQPVDPEEQVYDYVDECRQLTITARSVDDLDDPAVDASHDIGGGLAPQLERSCSGVPPRFKIWLHARLKEEVPDQADTIADCVWCVLANVDDTDLLDQLNAATDLLKDMGAPTAADELIAQRFAGLQ